MQNNKIKDYYSFSPNNGNEVCNQVGYYIKTNENDVVEFQDLKPGIIDVIGGIRDAESPVLDILSGKKVVENLPGPVVFELSGRPSANQVILHNSGWSLILSDEVFNYLDTLGLKDLYSKIPIMIINKKKERIHTNFNYIIVPKLNYPTETIPDAGYRVISDESDDTRLFGKFGVIVNEEVKNKLEAKFPSQFSWFSSLNGKPVKSIMEDKQKLSNEDIIEAIIHDKIKVKEEVKILVDLIHSLIYGLHQMEFNIFVETDMINDELYDDYISALEKIKATPYSKFLIDARNELSATLKSLGFESEEESVGDTLMSFLDSDGMIPDEYLDKYIQEFVNVEESSDEIDEYLLNYLHTVPEVKVAIEEYKNK